MYVLGEFGGAGVSVGPSSPRGKREVTVGTGPVPWESVEGKGKIRR